MLELYITLKMHRERKRLRESLSIRISGKVLFVRFINEPSEE